MSIVKQFSVSLANKPGVLANICRALADAKVNIVALTISDSIELAVLRMVVNKPDVARPILNRLDSSVTESEVLLVEMPNRPGVLATVMEKLSRAHININYAYATTGSFGGQTIVIIKVQYPQKVMKVLGESERKKEGRVPIRANSYRR